MVCSLSKVVFPFRLYQTEEDISPVLAPKPKEAPKEEPVETSSPLKPAASGSNRGTPNSKSTKTKRKANGDESKPTNGAPLKKVKTETVSDYYDVVLCIKIRCYLGVSSNRVSHSPRKPFNYVFETTINPTS